MKKHHIRIQENTSTTIVILACCKYLASASVTDHVSIRLHTQSLHHKREMIYGIGEDCDEIAYCPYCGTSLNNLKWWTEPSK